MSLTLFLPPGDISAMSQYEVMYAHTIIMWILKTEQTIAKTIIPLIRTASYQTFIFFNRKLALLFAGKKVWDGGA